MANTTRKAQVLITANASQATQTIRDLQRLALLLADDIQKASLRMQQMMQAGDTAGARKLQTEINGMTARMNSYTQAVDKDIEKTKTLGQVISDLANTKLRDLKAAMGQGKSALAGLTGSDADIAKARQIQSQMKEIGNQIRLIEGEYVKMADVMRDVSSVSDTTLQKAIKQQQDLVANLKRTEAGYEHQAAVLKRLQAEQTRRSTGYTVNQARQVAANTQAFSLTQMRTAVATLTNELNRLPSADANIKILRRDIETLQKAIKRVGEEQINVNDVLKRMKQGKVNLTELKQAYKQLEQELQTLTVKSKEYAATQAKMGDVKKQIDAATGALNKQSGAFATTIKNMAAYIGVFGTFGAFNMVKTKLTDIINLNMKYNDQLANIRKVSNMATDQVNELSRALAKIDTRTTIEEMNQIAYAGAKLGMANYGVDGLRQFTEAANQVNVALKEDLGEEALTALSKITEVMGLIPKMGVEQAMLKTGSAMFKLASTSTATSANIVEFSKRLLSLARNSSLTTADLLALGSAADSMALMPEVASTAMSKFLMKLQQSPGAIEKALKIPDGTIDGYLQMGQGMNAILTVFQAMSKQKNLASFESLFKDLGSDGTRLINTMISMAKNVKMLETHVQTSNDAFREGTAVTQEYNIQQETAAAFMERASNMWEKAFVNPEQVDVVKEISKAWYDLSDSLLHSATFMTDVRLTMTLLISSIKTMIAILPTAINMLSAAGLVGGFAKLITVTQGASMSLATLTTKFKELSLVQRAMGWGALIGLAVTLIGKMAEWTVSLNKLEAGQKAVNDVLEVSHRRYLEQQNKIQSLVNVAKDETASLDVRRKAIAKLNEIIPEYNAHLDKTAGKYIANAEALKKYNKELTHLYEVEGARDKLADIGKRKVEAMIDLEKKEQVYANTNVTAPTGPQTSSGGMMPSQAQGAIGQAGQRQAAKSARDAAQRALDDIKREEKAILDRWGKDLAVQDIPDKTETSGGGGGNNGNNGGTITNPDDEARNHINEFLTRIKDYYTRQKTAAIEEMTARGVAQELQDATNRQLDEHLQLVLKNAREAIVKENDAWKKLLDSGILGKDLLEKADENGWSQSQDLLTYLIGTDPVQFGKELDMVLAKIKHSKKEGDRIIGYKPEDSDELLRTRLLYQSSQGENKTATAQQKIAEQRRKDLIERQYTEVVKEETLTSMVIDGFFDVNALSKSFDQEKNSIISLLEKARKEIVAVLETNGDKNALLSVLGIDPSDNTFKPLLDMTAEDTKLFYHKLIQYANEYTEAQKKADDNQQKNMDKLYESVKRAEAEQQTVVTSYAKIYGSQQRLSSWNGITNPKSDPEVVLYQTKMEAAKRYYEFVLAHTQSEKVQADARLALVKAQEEYTRKVVDSIKERMQKLYSLGRPLEDFGSAMGEALDNFSDKTMTATERTEAFKNATLSAVKAMLKSWSDMFLAAIRAQMQQNVTNAQISRNLNATQPTQAAQKKVATSPDSIAMQAAPDTFLNRPKSRKAVVSAEPAQVIGKEVLDEAAPTDMPTESTALTQQQAEDQALLTEIDLYHLEVEERERTHQEKLAAIRANNSSGAGTADVGNIDADSEVQYEESKQKKIIGLNEGAQAALGAIKIKENKKQLKQQQRDQRKEDKVVKDSISDQTEAVQEGANTRSSVTKAVTDATVSTITTGNDIIVANQKTTDAESLSSSVTTQTGETAMNLTTAVAKAFSSLGPVGGAAAAAVIMALISGLLSWALGLIGGGKSSKASTNTKLASGMLTYDEGNISQFVGSDGRVYTARDAGSLPGGVSMVTSPIATTVNGQPSLVAERGPEIVIGRQTTSAIMQNAPYLLTMLAAYDRNNSRLRTFDSGNISDVMSGINADGTPQATSPTAQSDELTQTLSALTAVLDNIQRDGVRAHINKYGKGGLVDEVQSGLAFMSRH